MILIGFRQPSVQILLVEALIMLISPALAGMFLIVDILALALIGMFPSEEEGGPERALPYLLRPLYFMASEAAEAVHLHLSCHLLSRQVRRAPAPGLTHEQIL